MMDTIKNYDDNAKDFIAGTIDADMSYAQNKFLRYVRPNSRILDLGCGSGRDSLFFKGLGFSVTAVDGSPGMCKQASSIIGDNVRCLLFENLDYRNRFQGIWACASLLHVPKDDMQTILKKVSVAMVMHGILYVSYKYGTEQREKDGRLFSDYTEKNLDELFNPYNRLRVTEYWITADVRPGRAEEKWLNIICQKQ